MADERDRRRSPGLYMVLVSALLPPIISSPRQPQPVEHRPADHQVQRKKVYPQYDLGVNGQAEAPPSRELKS